MSQLTPNSSRPVAADAGNPGASASPDFASRPLGFRCRNLLPAAAWIRLGLLLGSLVAIKAALLFGLTKHLYEIHWRVSGEAYSWVNHGAFFVFVLSGMVGLLSLATHCRKKGLATVRAANAAVLFLGILFIFLTFRNGDKNYIYPIMTGTLQWSSLIPYLSLDLFFRPPFLAAWLFGYALVYYMMARTARETWTFHLTTLLAGTYAVLYLKELRLFRDELMVIDCFALACLLATLNFPNVSSKPLNLFWVVVPFLWALLYCALLRIAAPQLSQLDPYFRLLFGSTLVFFAATTLWAHRYGFFSAWIRLVPFFFVTFLLMTNSNHPLAHNYNNSLCLAFEFPHYFIGEVLLVVALAACAWACHRVWPNAGFRWLDVVNLILIAIAIVDLRLSQVMGVRLEWDVLTFGNSPKMMWRMARPYLPGVVLGLTAVVLLYAVALRAIRWWFELRIDRVRRKGSLMPTLSPGRGERDGAEGSGDFLWQWGLRTPGLLFVSASFLLLGILGWATAEPDKAEGESVLRLTASSPLWSRALNHTLGPEEFIKTANQLGLTFERANDSTVPQRPRDLNVVVVFMESSYNKYLSLFGSQYETQPLLSKYKDRMEIFPNFFSDFASSIHARFATFTSLHSVRDYNAFTLHRVNVKSLFEVLHENGYTCSLFYSSFFDYTGFGDFLKGRGIDDLFDANNMPGAGGAEGVSWGLKEETTLGAMCNQIKKYARQNQRFFLTYVPAAPHYPYDKIPRQFCKFKKEQMNDYTPLYLNELLYMDWVLASIVDQLQECHLLDHTLVIITNDHGEMLGGESGFIGHGWAFTPELANTPLIIMDPENRGWHVNFTIGAQVDFLPTVLDRLNLPLPSGQLYEGRSLYREEHHPDRRIYLNTVQQFGILEGNQIFAGDRDAAGNPRFTPTAFTISNQGAKTVFTASASSPTRPVSIRGFEEFQENLLRNYSVYCQAVCKDNNLAQPSGREAGSAVARASRHEDP